MSKRDLVVLRRLERMEDRLDQFEQVFTKLFKETETLRRGLLRLKQQH